MADTQLALDIAVPAGAQTWAQARAGQTVWDARDQVWCVIRKFRQHPNAKCMFFVDLEPVDGGPMKFALRHRDAVLLTREDVAA